MINESVNTLAESLTRGINNPDCAYFVGQSMGGYHQIQLIAIIMIGTLAYKALDKLIIGELLDKAKTKIDQWRNKTK